MTKIDCVCGYKQICGLKIKCDDCLCEIVRKQKEKEELKKVYQEYCRLKNVYLYLISD